MKIQIWSDFACPYCFIGKKHLDQAIENLGLKNVTLIHRVYQLDPGKISHPERTYLDGLKLSAEKLSAVKDKYKSITALAKEIDILMSLEGVLDVSTQNAQLLTLWSAQFGCDKALSDRIFKAQFIDNEDISNIKNLVKYAVEVGLNAKDAEAAIVEEKMLDALFNDNEEAMERDIELIPHFIIDDEFEIGGIVNTEILMDTLKRSKVK